jgi:signal peptidase I
MRLIFIAAYVPSASMEPAIKKDSFILGVRIVGNLARGDVVIFSHEGGLLVKRITAMPGDVTKIGATLLTIPDGCYVVMGDNRDNSIDSRSWENPFVPESAIIAKVLYLRI